MATGQALGQMDDITQQNAALVEQAAAAAQSMHDQAVKLSQAVAVFKISEVETTHLKNGGSRRIMQTKNLSTQVRQIAKSTLRAVNAN